MLETMRDIILSGSLVSIRMYANNGDLNMVQWHDGRLSVLRLLWLDSLEIQGAANEARFLCHYTRRHFKG